MTTLAPAAEPQRVGGVAHDTELLGHLDRGGAAAGVAGVDRAVDGEHLADLAASARDGSRRARRLRGPRARRPGPRRRAPPRPPPRARPGTALPCAPATLRYRWPRCSRAAPARPSGRRRSAGSPTRPAIAGSSSSSCATESNTGSLSSCRSRLYASGCAFSVASRPVRLPISRPDLPRASSAMSGFFFCGMIELPVDHESCSVT